jgi:small subunit ribosomal protein S4
LRLAYLTSHLTSLSAAFIGAAQEIPQCRPAFAGSGTAGNVDGAQRRARCALMFQVRPTGPTIQSCGISTKGQRQMTKRLASKYKINRRLGVNLWGRAKSPIAKRDYGPGQHGQRRRKPSDYGVQLMAKQKLKGYYGNIGEKQFRKYYQEAVRRKGDTSETLIELLERRLDSVVYRMKFAITPFAARQFVSHGHVLVNGRRVTIPSYLVRDNDVIEVREKSKQLAVLLDAVQNPERDVPEYLEVDHRAMRGRFVRAPKLSDVPYPVQMEPHLVVEYYSR